ncbi:MAG: (d)CMP kinase [Candidatus Brocadiia bacterium]
MTVDGPAAAGKSTVARKLAQRLGFRYLDTGAMYRAATWKALDAEADVEDPDELAAVTEETRIELTPDGRVLCDGRDVTEEIRTPEVTENIFHLADEPAVREVLIEQQRRFARDHDVVTEGRDQGTEVFPDAEVKFFLVAGLEERARRRLQDLQRNGRDPSLREVKRQVMERDAKDRSRPVGALRKTEDMILIDSTDMTADQVVEAMFEEVSRRLPAS